MSRTEVPIIEARRRCHLASVEFSSSASFVADASSISSSKCARISHGSIGVRTPSALNAEDVCNTSCTVDSWNSAHVLFASWRRWRRNWNSSGWWRRWCWRCDWRWDGGWQAAIKRICSSEDSTLTSTVLLHTNTITAAVIWAGNNSTDTIATNKITFTFGVVKGWDESPTSLLWGLIQFDDRDLQETIGRIGVGWKAKPSPRTIVRYRICIANVTVGS
jgi:hypothetical protein